MKILRTSKDHTALGNIAPGSVWSFEGKAFLVGPGGSVTNLDNGDSERVSLSALGEHHRHAQVSLEPDSQNIGTMLSQLGKAVAAGELIPVVKEIRSATGLGLKDAKKLADEFLPNYREIDSLKRQVESLKNEVFLLRNPLTAVNFLRD